MQYIMFVLGFVLAVFIIEPAGTFQYLKIEINI